MKMTRRRIKKPVKEVKLPKEHFEKVLKKAKKNEEFWKKLANVSDDEAVEVDAMP